MLTKLAARNVKRQIGNYLIYFITVTLTVSLMFAMNNIIYSEQLMQIAQDTGMVESLIGISVVVAVIVAFVLGYATSFMLKLRKREFGTYLTMGMTRGNILSIFILETLIMGVVALALGIVLGLFIYQGMMAVLSKLMEMEIAIASYSFEGLILTIVLVLGIFALSSATSAVYLKKVSIYDLIHGSRKVSKKVKHPAFWFFVTILSFLGIIFCCILFQTTMDNAIYGRDSGTAVINVLFALAATIVFFHIGLARSMVNLLLKNNREFCARGTNTFILRQLSAKLGSNSVMAGILAFLISFAVIGANVSFVQKVSERVTLDAGYPFDIRASFNPGENPPIGIEEGKKIISEFSEIESVLSYKTYTNGKSYLHGFTQWSGEGYSGLTDTFMSESDFNAAMKALGKEPVNLEGGFKIISDIAAAGKTDFSGASLENNGLKLGFKGIIENVPRLVFVYFVAIVPDDFIKGMEVENAFYGMDLKNERYDAEALYERLSYEEAMEYSSGEEGGEVNTVNVSQCDYSLKEYSRIQGNATSAILIIGSIYAAIVFIFMAIAILALKTLAGITEDKQRYKILYRLGADRTMQNQALFRQIVSFFILPFVVPVLMSIPAGYTCGRIMGITGHGESSAEVYITAAAIALVIIAIYLLYLLATYLIAKRNIFYDR